MPRPDWLGPLLDELSDRSWYHHELALVAATAGRDEDRLRPALNHPSPRIRSFALAHYARAGAPVDHVFDALVNGSP